MANAKKCLIDVTEVGKEKDCVPSAATVIPAQAGIQEMSPESGFLLPQE